MSTTRILKYNLYDIQISSTGIKNKYRFQKTQKKRATKLHETTYFKIGVRIRFYDV